MYYKPHVYGRGFAEINFEWPKPNSKINNVMDNIHS